MARSCDVVDDVVSGDVCSLGDSSGVVEVDNEKGLLDALSNDNVKEIKIIKDIQLSKSITVPARWDLIIDGQNHKISPGSNYVAQGAALTWYAGRGHLNNCVFVGFVSGMSGFVLQSLFDKRYT